MTTTIDNPLITPDIRAVFEEALADGKDHNNVLITLVNSGIPVVKVRKLFRDLMELTGRSIKKANDADLVAQLLAGYEFVTKEGYDKAIEILMSAIPNTNRASAARKVVWHCRRNNLSYYKRVESAGGNGTRGPRTNFMSDFFKALVANPLMTDADLDAMIAEASALVQSREQDWHLIRKTVNAVARSGELYLGRAATRSRGSFIRNLCEALVANPHMTEAEVQEMIDSSPVASVKSREGTWLKICKTVNAVANGTSLGGDGDEEGDEEEEDVAEAA